ncbi:MAG: type II toxin-antitoxin system RelE/ParE family toxin [Rhodospirillales bacterium]|nr:type II toxin-antitoxin system RelE/ParE family toxin [Rhodospirillales bacterium]
MIVRFHPLVRRDVREIVEYYDARSNTAGARFLEEFAAAVERIRRRPLSFHPLDAKRRRSNLVRFPHHLVFEVKDGEVHILVVRHHKRHPGFGQDRH